MGRAAPLCDVTVVDELMQELTLGEIGEIAFRGDTVMLGYANLPELTAETIKDGWLRSGDLGWMDEDGFIYIVDRKKDVIITGGENVYSSEVELVLTSHPAINEAVVIGVPDDHWGERVHGLVVPAGGTRPDTEEIRAYCRERLAAFKVPKAVEIRADLPRLPTGKIAKAEVRKEFWTGQETGIHAADGG